MAQNSDASWNAQASAPSTQTMDDAAAPQTAPNAQASVDQEASPFEAATAALGRAHEVATDAAEHRSAGSNAVPRGAFAHGGILAIAR